MMSDHEWKETTGKGNCHIWTAMGDLGTRIIELGSREEMEARWPALLLAFPDAWMTESQHVSRTRVLRGAKK
jgi:hypothetical protein